MEIKNKQIKGDEEKIKTKKEFHFTSGKGRAEIVKADSQKEANEKYKSKHKEEDK